MATLPYVTATGNIPKAIEGIKKAATPPKVSGDFVKTKLGIRGGSGDQITSYLKKIGLADSSGSPTDLYGRVRNDATRGQAIADCLRFAYAPLFEVNEFAYDLNDDELKGLIVQVTGNAEDSNPVKMALSSFKALKQFADFEADASLNEVPTPVEHKSDGGRTEFREFNEIRHGSPKLNIGYNIHLNLPATDDIAVFNAIFKSLKENLLTDDE